MKVAWIALSVLLAMNVSAALAQDAAFQPPAKEKFHLYLLMGQSNMAGRGKIEAQDKQPHPRVVKFTKEMTWAPGVDPLHFDKKGAGVGLGTSFGRAMADADPEVTIGLIPTAVGGTPLKRWEKGGDLYENAVARAKVALQHGTLRGILWHQGENDAGNPKTAATYAQRLAGMIADLRKDLDAEDVPFVAGELGIFGASKPNQPDPKIVINQQLATMPSQVKGFAVVPSTGTQHNGDGTHFSSASLRTFGQRYAEAMQKLQKSPRP